MTETIGEDQGRPVVRRAGGGYVLDVDPDSVDLHRSRSLVGQATSMARSGGDRYSDAVDLLREACSLWRGTPLAGLTADWATRVRDGLEQEKLATHIARYTMELRLGEHATALGPLAELLADYPLVEPIAGLHMLALYRCGQMADALDTYARTRQQLVDQLGDEPGPELRQLHEQVLRRDRRLDLEPAEVVAQAAAELETPLTPAQLPLDIAVFAGREHELHELDELVADGPRASHVVVTAIGGMGGVGKTALAVHWARRVADKFPDGQLYANLAGYGPDAQPKDPVEILHGFLDAMQVPADRIPRRLDALTATYRSVLHDRKMLIVLDNARNADQIRHLLPGGPGCFVLITSRSRLTSLVATEGAHTLTLDRLTSVEARQLLERRLGTDWLEADPVATDEIISRCGHLPLALAVVAARVTCGYASPASGVAAALCAADGSLELLSGPDTGTDLQTVFSWSYRALSAGAADMFRFLGLWPGPDFSGSAVASLAGVPARLARRLLVELTHAHLISEHSPGMFGIHDLLRAYAAMVANDHDSEAVRANATLRVLDFYVHAAHRVAVMINPQREPIDLPPSRPMVAPVEFDDQQVALAWLSSEYPSVKAWLAWAARAGHHTQTWQLAWALPDFLQRQGLWNEWASSQQLGLDAAQHLNQPQAEALALRSLASAYGALGRFDDAHRHLSHALELFTELGDRMQHARTRLVVSSILIYQDRYEEALIDTRQTLALFEEAGDVGGQAYAYNGMAWLHARLGEHNEALTNGHHALSLQRRVGDSFGQAATWDTIGHAYYQVGRYQKAIDAYKQSIVKIRAHGARFREAEVVARLGDALYAHGDRHAARQEWSHSLRLLDEFQGPEAADLRAKLSASMGADDPETTVDAPSVSPL